MNQQLQHASSLLFIFIFITCSLQAQINPFGTQPRATFGGFKAMEVPVYRSKADSLALVKQNELLESIVKQLPPNQKRIDSLVYQRSKLMETAITGFKTMYYPHDGYFPFDSLQYISDKSHITHLSINRYAVKSLWPQVMLCKNLQVLELVNCTVHTLPSELSQLKELRKIQILNNKSRHHLKLKKNLNVREIAFRGDSPKSLPKSFRRYDSLTKIDLSQNNLTRFPNAARHNRKLIEFELQRNKITLKQNNLKPHPWVRGVGLQHNKIDYVPSSVKNFSNVKKLAFNHNAITDVSPAIGQLQKLEELSFYNNKMEAVPEGVYQIRSLKVVDLFHNRIFKLEDKITNWQHLHTLYVSHNHLSALPDVINQLPSLNEIYAYDNSIQTLPATLCDISQLKVLRININEIKTLPSCFDKLTRMEELDLSDNKLTELPAAIFQFSDLKILAIVDNPWNNQLKSELPAIIRKLRERQVAVHLDSYGEEEN